LHEPYRRQRQMCIRDRLQIGARMTGKDAVYQRLCGSLQVDISHARNTLGWSPVVTPREGLKLAVK
ncbi:hypothetical protein GFL91_32580, partial [Rhizobium leguminosarum bv. viciae]|nr:hypothetical protein [Rhizobium leguminosarum bv. viciae]